MKRRLGLDLGSNSIGWALVQDDGKIVAAGVRVFPEGVDRDQQGGELSKNETRRIARGMRRQIVRRAKRKRRLRAVLVEAGLLPPCASLDRSDPQRAEWEAGAFCGADPYSLRRRALDEKLAPHELGRALLHLAQRRGFLSNRKTDKDRKKEASQMLDEIGHLEAEIQAAGVRTLGEYLASLARANPLARLRARHTRREMHKTEFQAIWAAQSPHHPQILTEELRKKLHQLIFYQRPIRVPKNVVGTCELEPRRRRCPRADRRAQRFRMLQEVNNLSLIDENGEERGLNAEERTRLLEYLAASDKRSFDDIRKHLGFLESVRFNLERGNRTKLLGMRTDKVLSHKDRFGKAWATLEEERKNQIVRALLEEEDDALRRLAVEEWGRTPEQAESLLEADLPPGYASYCREAIAKLLPHLERGLPMMSDDDSPCAILAAGYLRPDQREVQRRESLPLPPDLPNPIVRQALHEVRKVVNAIIREYGKLDRIHVELAREVKGSLQQRAEYTRRIREREGVRDRAADAIREAGARPTADLISRYLLWQEQGQECVYTGKPISLRQLLAGEVDVDHILPKPRSLDDSLMNKVICFRSANADKGDRTPYEWLAGSSPERYAQILQRARKLPHYGKYRKFQQQNVKLDEFIHRQLTDTAYISRAVRAYLRPLVPDPLKDIVCTKGQLTAELRRGWGLNEILRDDGLNLKTREDHRHHAIDAIVIAITDRSRLQALARQDVAPPPRESFHQEVEELVNGIHISHRVQRKVSGALHEETLYARTRTPGEFVTRKPLSVLTAAEVERIRDDAVREKVLSRLKEFNIVPGRKKKGASGDGKIPKEVWAKPLWMNEDKRIPIQKVRLTKRDQTIREIRGGVALAKPGGNHHVCFFEKENKAITHYVTMMEAAGRVRAGTPIICRSHPAFPDARFIMSLSRGELVAVDWDGQNRLLRFKTGPSTEGQTNLQFIDAADARADKDQQKFNASPTVLLTKRKARKVTVDLLGRLRWAND